MRKLGIGSSNRFRLLRFHVFTLSLRGTPQPTRGLRPHSFNVEDGTWNSRTLPALPLPSPGVLKPVHSANAGLTLPNPGSCTLMLPLPTNGLLLLPGDWRMERVARRIR